MLGLRGLIDLDLASVPQSWTGQESWGGAAGRVPWWGGSALFRPNRPRGSAQLQINVVEQIERNSQICEFRSNRSPPMGIYFCFCSCHSNSHALKGYNALNAAKGLRTQQKTPKRETLVQAMRGRCVKAEGQAEGRRVTFRRSAAGGGALLKWDVKEATIGRWIWGGSNKNRAFFFTRGVSENPGWCFNCSSCGEGTNLPWMPIDSLRNNRCYEGCTRKHQDLCSKQSTHMQIIGLFLTNLKCPILPWGLWGCPTRFLFGIFPFEIVPGPP